MTKESQSLLDILVRLMPELRGLKKQKADPKEAKLLYAIWSDEKNKIANKTYRRPNDVKQAEIDRLKTAGLVDVSGENIEITKKGGVIINQMILGDDRSVFEDNGEPISYLTALANLKPSRQRKYGKVASVNGTPIQGGNWYLRMTGQ